MSKRYESSRGHQFTQEEIEDLPPFDVENNDFEAELEYENEHGISPLEVREIIDELEREREVELENELESDTMVDIHGQPYEQLKLNLDDEPEQVETEVVEDEPKKKTRWKDKFNAITESFQQAKQSVDNVSTKTAITVMTKQDEMFEHLQNKHDLVAKNIEAKSNILDFANGTITKEELAYRMANDSDLQESIGQVSHSMLHPSPIKGLKTERTHLHLDVGYGFSVFMEEMRKPTENEVEAIMEIDNMTMLVEMGQDKNIPPNIRENYLREAGVTDDSMAEFVTRDDYRDYVVALEQQFRTEHMERLGLLDKDVLDVEDENMLNELVEDSMSLHDSERDTFEYISGPEGEIQNTYKETYNMSSEDMFHMFDNVDNYDGLEYEDLQFPEYVDYDFEDAAFMQQSVEEFHQLQNMSIAESEAYLQTIADEMQALEAQQSTPRQEAPDEPLTLNDEDLAMLDMMDQHAPPELSDEDLANLGYHEPELNNDDLDDLRDDGQHRQQ